jgi:hypothetical protein
MTYFDIAINAMFTGIGTAVGLWIFETYLKKKADKIHEKVTTGDLGIKIPDSQSAIDKMLGRKE